MRPATRVLAVFVAGIALHTEGVAASRWLTASGGDSAATHHAATVDNAADHSTSPDHSTSSDHGTSHEEHSGDHTGGHDEEHAHQYDVLFFLFNGIILGTAVVHVTSYVPSLNWVQPTVATFALGMFYALIMEVSGSEDTKVVGESYSMWMKIDPHVLLFTMLPLLLTGDAMTIDTSVARMVAKQCLYLAGPGVVISTFLTALFLWLYLPYDWPFLLCLTVGSIMAATDPVAVVSLLKELGASPILTVQIQGESLLNDGMAIVVFSVAYNMLKGQKYEVKDMALFVVKTALCAWLLGALIGGMFSVWIRAASNRLDHASVMIQISLTVCCAYVSFFVAEGVFEISGVLSTVAASLVLADNMWSCVVSKEAMHEVWHTFEFFGNTIIFFLAGALTVKAMVVIPFKDYLYLFYLWFILILIRGGMLFASRPVLQLLSSDRTPVSVGDAIVMTWGGLRGAVGLALAIQVNVDRAHDHISSLDGDRVLFYTGGVASLTMLINATTCPAVVSWLGLTQTSTTKKHILLNIHEQLQKMVSRHGALPGVNQVLEDKLAEIEFDICPEGFKEWQEAEKLGQRSKLMKESYAGMVQRNARDLVIADDSGGHFLTGEQLVDMLHSSKEMLTSAGDSVNLLGSFPAMPLLDEEDEKGEFVTGNLPDRALLRALHEALLVLVRAQYWNQIESGQFVPGTTTADLLLNSISHAIHFAGRGLTDLDFIEGQLGLNPLLSRPADPESQPKGWFSKKLKQLMRSRSENPTSPKKKNAGGLFSAKSVNRMATTEFVDRVERSPHLHKFVTSMTFQSTILGIIIANTIAILAEDASMMKDNIGWLVSDVFFATAFVCEFALKFHVFRRKYFYDGWNVLDFMCMIMTLLSLAVRVLVVTDATAVEHIPSEAELLRLNRILRVMRVFRAATMFHVVRILIAQYKDRRVKMNPKLAQSLDIIQAMKAFATAHICAHYEFLRYFGDNGTVESVEEVHCILESRMCVYMALVRAALEASKVDEVTIQALNIVSETMAISTEMSQYVQEALSTGIVSKREAELINEPLQKHGEQCDMIRADAHMGLESRMLSDYKHIVQRFPPEKTTHTHPPDGPTKTESFCDLRGDPSAWDIPQVIVAELLITPIASRAPSQVADTAPSRESSFCSNHTREKKDCWTLMSKVRDYLASEESAELTRQQAQFLHKEATQLLKVLEKPHFLDSLETFSQ